MLWQHHHHNKSLPGSRCARERRGKRISTARRACLADCGNLSCRQSKASHTLSPAMEGQDPALDCSVGNSPLSHSLPCTALDLKYRGGSWQRPRADGGRASPAKSFRRKVPALSGQTLIRRKRHGPSLPVPASSKEQGRPTSPAPQPLCCAPQGERPSLPFTRCLGGQRVLTLRGVEMAAGMWAGKKKNRKREKKKKKKILRLVQTYSCLYWSL